MSPNDVKAMRPRIEQDMDDLVTPQPAKDKLSAAAAKNQIVRYDNTLANVKAWHEQGLNGWLMQHLIPATHPGESSDLVASKHS